MGGGDSRRSPRLGHHRESSAGPRTRQPRHEGLCLLPAKQLRPRTPWKPPCKGLQEQGRSLAGRHYSVLVPRGYSHSGLLPPGLCTWGLLPPTTASPSEAEPELLPGHPRD